MPFRQPHWCSASELSRPALSATTRLLRRFASLLLTYFHGKDTLYGRRWSSRTHLRMRQSRIGLRLSVRRLFQFLHRDGFLKLGSVWMSAQYLRSSFIYFLKVCFTEYARAHARTSVWTNVTPGSSLQAFPPLLPRCSHIYPDKSAVILCQTA